MATSSKSPHCGLTETSNVRVVSYKADPYEGLKGHAYIVARGLSAHVNRVQTSAHNQDLAPVGASNG